MAAAFLIGTIGLEGAARLVRMAAGHGGNAQAAKERETFLSTIPGEARLPQRDAGRQRFVDMAYGARYEIHPYFGHTFFRQDERVNNQGYFTDKSYPYRAAESELVVGVFGGSVAMQIAGASRLQESLLPIARARGFEKVTVLPFAIGAWREPQPFFAFVWFVESLDMAIFLDGFNEAIQLSSDHLRSYPVRFPSSDVFGALATSEASPYEARDRAILSLLNEWAVQLTRKLDRSWLGKSMAVHLTWRALARWYGSLSEKLRLRSSAGARGTWAGVDVVGRPEDIDTNREDYFRFYEGLIRNASLIARDRRKLLFHFIQPNQYLRGSKPLSADEVEHFTGNPWFDQITPNYLRLEKMTRALRAADVDSTFLGWLFAAERDTLYTDGCCHFNPAGVDRVVDAIVDQIAKSPQLDLLPTKR